MGIGTISCDRTAAFRFTWPGEDEKVICADHASKLQTIAQSIGLYVQMIPVNTCAENLDLRRCSQQIKEDRCSV